MDLPSLIPKIREKFDAKNGAREQALKLSRATIRSCALSIRAIHRKEFPEAEKNIAEAKAQLVKAQELLSPFADIYHAGFLHDAEKEYAEACTTFALVNGQPAPKPSTLGISDAAYIVGLGDVVGELRRSILDLIRVGDLEFGEALLKAMDDIYYFMLSFDYPDAITPGLKRSTDVTKSIMEKTRGDLTTAIRDEHLRSELQRAEEAFKRTVS